MITLNCLESNISLNSFKGLVFTMVTMGTGFLVIVLTPTLQDGLMDQLTIPFAASRPAGILCRLLWFVFDPSLLMTILCTVVLLNGISTTVVRLWDFLKKIATKMNVCFRMFQESMSVRGVYGIVKKISCMVGCCRRVPSRAEQGNLTFRTDMKIVDIDTSPGELNEPGAFLRHFDLARWDSFGLGSRARTFFSTLLTSLLETGLKCVGSRSKPWICIVVFLAVFVLLNQRIGEFTGGLIQDFERGRRKRLNQYGNSREPFSLFDAIRTAENWRPKKILENVLKRLEVQSYLPSSNTISSNAEVFTNDDVSSFYNDWISYAICTFIHDFTFNWAGMVVAHYKKTAVESIERYTGSTWNNNLDTSYSMDALGSYSKEYNELANFCPSSYLETVAANVGQRAVRLKQLEPCRRVWTREVCLDETTIYNTASSQGMSTRVRSNSENADPLRESNGKAYALARQVFSDVHPSLLRYSSGRIRMSEQVEHRRVGGNKDNSFSFEAKSKSSGTKENVHPAFERAYLTTKLLSPEERSIRQYFLRTWERYKSISGSREQFQYCIPNFWRRDMLPSDIKTTSHEIERALFECRPHFLSYEVVGRGEDSYWEDFIETQLSVGFDHFFIYLNEDDAKYDELKRNVFDKYIAANIVTLEKASPKVLKKAQHLGLVDTVLRRRETTFWFARADADELFYGPKIFRGSFLPFIFRLILNYIAISTSFFPNQFTVCRINAGNHYHYSKPELPMALAYTRVYPFCTSIKSLYFVANMDPPLIVREKFDRNGVLKSAIANPRILSANPRILLVEDANTVGDSNVEGGDSNGMAVGTTLEKESTSANKDGIIENMDDESTVAMMAGRDLRSWRMFKSYCHGETIKNSSPEHTSEGPHTSEVLSEEQLSNEIRQHIDEIKARTNVIRNNNMNSRTKEVAASPYLSAYCQRIEKSLMHIYNDKGNNPHRISPNSDKDNWPDCNDPLYIPLPTIVSSILEMLSHILRGVWKGICEIFGGIWRILTTFSLSTTTATVPLAQEILPEIGSKHLLMCFSSYSMIPLVTLV